jgi:hypothetical protein
MSSDFKASQLNTDEIRLRQYRTQMENRHEYAVKEMRDRQDHEIGKMFETFQDQKQSLENAYSVQISKEAENLEEKLQNVRVEQEARISTEKQAYERELQNMKLSQQKQIEDYRKQGEVQLEKLKRELQATSDQIHIQAKKTARREKETLG